MLNLKKLLIQLIKQFLSKIYLYDTFSVIDKEGCSNKRASYKHGVFLGIYNKMSRVSFYLLAQVEVYIYIGNAGTDLFYNNLNPLIYIKINQVLMKC